MCISLLGARPWLLLLPRWVTAQVEEAFWYLGWSKAGVWQTGKDGKDGKVPEESKTEDEPPPTCLQRVILRVHCPLVLGCGGLHRTLSPGLHSLVIHWNILHKFRNIVRHRTVWQSGPGWFGLAATRALNFAKHGRQTDRQTGSSGKHTLAV